MEHRGSDSQRSPDLAASWQAGRGISYLGGVGTGKAGAREVFPWKFPLPVGVTHRLTAASEAWS